MATSTLGASPGVVMSWSEMWTWKADTPASVPAGARISAGNSGRVARSLPNSALALVKRSPVSCMPSPESPAKRMMTRSSSRGVTRSAVSDTWTPLSLAVASCGAVGGCRRPRRRRSAADAVVSIYRRERARDDTPPWSAGHRGRRAGSDSGDRDGGVEIDVLDGVEQLDALGRRPLERLAAADQALPPARLLITAVRTASARSLAPLDSPPELMSPMRPCSSWPPASG